MIAFVISAYRLPRQLVRLISRLQAPGRQFYIHVDLKAPSEMFSEASAALAGHDNVHWLPRHVCNWGDFGHVRATLKGLDHLVSSGRPFSQVVLLTGQDYPIKDNGLIDRFLAQHSGQSFMNHRPLPVEGLPAGGYERLPAALNRRVPYGLHPHFGSGYWCLDRQAVEYVITFLRSHPGYVSFFEHVHVPDEMFFQTILLNSPLASTIVNDDCRYIRWPGPAVLTSADWEALRGSPDLFARKFDEGVDAAILERLDRELLR